MAIYIQSSSGDIYYMDAVFSASYSQSGTPTNYYVESGVNESDHYTQEPDTLNLNGAVSQVKFSSKRSFTTDLDVFEKELTGLKKGGEFFSVNFSDNLNPLQNCLFTNLSMSRSTQTGRYSIDVSMSISQVSVATAAGITVTPTPLAEFADVVEEKSNSSESTVSATTPQQVKLYEISQELTPSLKPVYGALVE